MGFGVVAMRGLAARAAFFLRNESGAAAAEYGILLATVVIVLAVAAALLGDSLTNTLQDAANCVEVGCSS